MSSSDLPTEIDRIIGTFLGHQSDINSLCQASRRLYHTLNQDLYRDDAQHGHHRALFYAAETRNMSTARLSIYNGCPTMVKNSKGLIPLHLASANGHESMVKLLLEKARPIYSDARDSIGQPFLHLAAKNGHGGVVKLLLELGNVDVGARDYWA